MRNKAISSLLADDEYIEIQDKAYNKVQQVSMDYENINLLFKERLKIKEDFIVNGTPLLCDDSRVISWHRLHRSYDAYI
jgi:hypothetical protein